MTERLERIMEAGFATLADLVRETNQRLDRTNERLEETNLRLGRLEGRFDHFIETAGEHNRELREELHALAKRVDVLERKASAVLKLNQAGVPATIDPETWEVVIDDTPPEEMPDMMPEPDEDEEEEDTRKVNARPPSHYRTRTH